MPDIEIDFPRGGSTRPPGAASGAGARKRPATDTSCGTKKGKAASTEGAALLEYENVFRQPLSVDLLTEDVRGLACVKKIGEVEITLETAEGIQLTLPARNVSRSFASSLGRTSATLDDIFVVGQAIAYRVTKASPEKGAGKNRSFPEVSTCPASVNAHLVAASLVDGLVINGAVTSIEEKGAVVSLGISDKISGFVAKDDLPPYLSLDKLHIGQVVLFRVKKTTASSSRVVNLSAYAEMSVLDQPKLSLDQLAPGTILYAEPEKVVTTGAFVSLGSGVKGFISKMHLPPRLRSDMQRFVKALRVTVLCCKPHSTILVLSGHPDIVALSKPEKRHLIEDFAIGDRVECVVCDVDKKGNVYFTFQDESDKASLLAAKALRIHIDDYDNSISKFSIGSVHKCRIIGYHAMERLLMVSTKESTLRQNVVSSEDAKPGVNVKGTVVAVKPNGLTVDIGQGLCGYVTVMHVADRTTAKWDKQFDKGQKIQCRVLYVDPETERIMLTAKPALVNANYKIVTERSKDLVGTVTVGAVIKALDSGGLIVSFFNRIVGLLKGSDAKKVPSVQLGMPLKVRIAEVDVENEHIMLALGDSESNNSDEQAIAISAKPAPKKTPKTKEKVKLAKPFEVYAAKVVGPWRYGGTSKSTSAELLLDGGTVGRLHASELDLHKYQEGSAPMKTFLEKNTGKRVNVKVISVGRVKTLSPDGKAKLISEHETIRIAECTMNELKLQNPRKKLKLLNYRTEFDHGERIPVFITTGGTDSHECHIPAEVNPLYHSLIPRERLTNTVSHSTEDPVVAPVLPDFQFEDGELAYGYVLGINKTRRSKCVEVSLVKSHDLSEGEKVVGRVDSIQQSPLKFFMKLSNGQRGVVTPTGVQADFKPTDQLASCFIINETYPFVAWAFNESSRQWLVVTPQRQTPSGKAGLFRAPSELKEGHSLEGYVVAVTDKHAVVELSPGIVGFVRSNDSTSPLAVNDLVTVSVASVRDSKISLRCISEPVSAKKIRKRTRSSGSDSAAVLVDKSAAAGFQGEAVNDTNEVPSLNDPGFDWSLSGFTMSDFAQVGRTPDSEGVKSKKSKREDTTESAPPAADVGEKVPKDQTKKDTADDAVKREKRIGNVERHLLEALPDSELAFDRLVTGNPNSSDIWIKYIAYFLHEKNYVKAKMIAERALSVINYREEAELLNVWTAYLNMEVAFGSDESTKEVFDRAITRADSLKIHKQMARILSNHEKIEALDELYESMLKRFRHDDIDVWFLYGQHLLETGRSDKARELLQKAISSLPMKHHVMVLSRFAQLEYKYGDAERGKTMLEKILHTYSKNSTVWALYVDMVLKHEGIDEARKVFERAVTSGMNAHKTRTLFKKWMDAEAKYGDEETLKMVKRRALGHAEVKEER